MHVTIAPQDLAAAWTFEPPIIAGIVVTSWLYTRGVNNLRRRAPSARGAPSWRVLAFAAGIAATAVALVSPLAAAGGALFSAHMVQHLVLMLIAAPLLVLGAPLRMMIWAFPPGWRRRLGRLAAHRHVRSAWNGVANPVVAWAVHATAIWVWHLPALFTLTLVSETAHVAQHLSFFLTALLFWWAIAAPGRRRMPAAAGVLYVFTTAVHSSILGALLTFADLPLYPEYAPGAALWGLSPLEDQQLAGLLMWIPGGTLYLAAALVILGAWLRTSPRQFPVERLAAGD